MCRGLSGQRHCHYITKVSFLGVCSFSMNIHDQCKHNGPAIKLLSKVRSNGINAP